MGGSTVSSFLNTQTVYISTLTPVHVGSGEDYYPTNYVIDEGYLHYFGELQLLEALAPAELQTLAGIAEKERGQESLRQIQAFIHQKGQKLAPWAQHRVPVTDGVARLYRDRIGRTAQNERDGRRISNQLIIQRNSFNPHGETPYIPGSSVKGALRTALLDALNKGDSLPLVTDHSGRERRENNQELQQRLLAYDFRHLENDPLRLLKIGDASYRHPEGLNGLEIRFAVNRKRKRSDKPSRADQGPPILLECLAANRSRSFTATLALQDDPILRQVRNKLPFRDFRELAARVNRYALPQFKAELKRLEELGYADQHWLADMRALLRDELEQAFLANQAFLLRLGRYGGAESKTLDGVRSIKIMQGPGKPPKYQHESTTVWLAADDRTQQGGMLPFGWILVELDDAGLRETHAFLRRNAQAAYDRLEQEQKRKSEAERLRAERCRAEADARRQAAEETARAEAQAARFAAMSENQQRTEALRGEMTAANKGKGPGSQLYDRLRNLIQEAASWDESDRQALHPVAVEIFDWLGIRKDDGKRKKLLRSLMAP
jgi:CRISPR-associated protein Csm5